MSTLSTHVLDTTQGHPAQGIPIHLHRLTPPATAAVEVVGAPSSEASLSGADTAADLSAVGSGTTDTDGRVTDFGCGELEPGTYRLWFDVATYAKSSGQEMFFPEVVVTFTITDERHYHVPLLLSPFAYSTYRGS